LKKWDLPEGWEWKKLGEIASISDRNHTTPSYKNSGYPLVSPTMFTEYGIGLEKAKFVDKFELLDFKKKCAPSKGDLLYSRIGSIGKARIIDFDNDFVALHSIAVIKPKKTIVDNRFLYYFLNSVYGTRQANAGIRSISVPDLGLEKIENFSIPTPPLETQQKIVAILDKAKEIKRLRTEANYQTQMLIQSVFLDVFGDPVKNPKKWSTSRIGNISSKISSGSTPLGGSEVYLKSGVLFIRSQNVLMSHLSLEDAAFIDKKTHEDMKRTWVNHGDVLLNITGASIGRVAWYDGENSSANVNQHVCIIRPDQKKILPEFLAFQISIPSFQQKIMMRQSGATRQAFNYAQISDFHIIMPDITIQKHFVEIMKAIGEASRQQHLLGLQLLSCQNNLLSQAFTGELVA